MLNNQAIKLVHAAARGAGLITKSPRCKPDDRRYRLLLAQYKAASCQDLSNSSLEDFLAICESLGWANTKGRDYYRDKIAKRHWSNRATPAQRSAIDYLRGDLGWTAENLKGFIRRMTGHEKELLSELTRIEAHGVIEGLKAIFGRSHGMTAQPTLEQIQNDTEVTHAQTTQAC